MYYNDDFIEIYQGCSLVITVPNVFTGQYDSIRIYLELSNSYDIYVYTCKYPIILYITLKFKKQQTSIFTTMLFTIKLARGVVRRQRWSIKKSFITT